MTTTLANLGGAAVQPLDEDRLAWLAMALTPGLGPRRIVEAMRNLEPAGSLFELPLTGLEALQLPAPAAQFIFDGKARRAAEQEWETAAQASAAIVTVGCAAYPERLREIYDPPPVLWARGDVSLLARPSLAIVGTRHPSPYGSGVAEMIARDLSARRLLIVSGMARGIDTSAHKGAIAARMPTIAVWGTGIDVVYPKENRRLAEQILELGGAIVSEVPMGTFPAPQNFPRRNRIISGVSIGVLVVEASENSGTRVTARCAEEQNRDVFAIPGNVTSKNSWTPNTLIKQGAKLVASWEDVWEELPSDVRIQLEGEKGVASEAAPGASLLADPPLRPEEAMVMEHLRADESLQIDEILSLLETQLTSSEVFTALFELEMAGRVRQLPGKNYVRVL
ncbi:DNA-processing protein DprA [Occallatibacter riparius]|uniref:DNA-processing protein DprA n=1 Tax=Occallatibacter riparius TaxID=1002689 RepID=A0A9J7BPW1_9BACT|nr:DNA-processing protein DprA [Occallatibacter riparius]UWZ82974.1 DNA-processing protein DprA [Occallatibacter riparius]